MNKLEDDHVSLFKFILVNRQIGEMAISILWKNPFNYQYLKIHANEKYDFIIQTYINCFNEEEFAEINSLLMNSDLTIQSNKTSLLFDYGKYLKEFKINELT